jgi:hypothetical protein
MNESSQILGYEVWIILNNKMLLRAQDQTVKACCVVFLSMHIPPRFYSYKELLRIFRPSLPLWNLKFERLSDMNRIC